MTRILTILLATLFAALTVAGQTPYLVRDINTTTRNWIYGSSPAYFTADGETTYFFATTHTGRELWKYAGGSAALVRRFVPPTTFTQLYPHSLTRLGSGIVVFVADDGVHKSELWRTDGTEAGTVMVRDIHPGAGDANVTILGVWGGRVYFSADDGVNGEELWTSDGTEAGTTLLKNFDGTSASSGPMSIAGFFGDRLLVATRSDLWLTDGTEAGTTLVKANVSPVAPVIIGSKAYFRGRDSTAGRELWVTDGTENGTTRVIDLAPGEADGMTSAPVVLGATAILFHQETASAVNLYVSDGTAAGTQFVAQIERPAICGLLCNPAVPERVVANGIAYWRDYGGSLWRSDGTAAGTSQLESSGVLFPPFVAFGGMVHYAKEGAMMKTDGTPGGTTTAFALPDVTEVANVSLTGGKLYFSARDGNGAEPWVSSDGATASLLANLAWDPPPSTWPSFLTFSGNHLFFWANDGLSWDGGIWRTDGSEAGTIRLQAAPEGNRGNPIGGGLLNLTAFGGAAWWMANGVLWRSDGSVAGTAEFQPFAGFERMMPFPSFLYINTSLDLWRTDGTAAGTLKVEPAEGALGRIHWMVDLAGRQYFFSGRGFGRTEGLPGTTKLIGGTQPKYDSGVIAALGALYFSTSDGIHGNELWRSDGTREGTTLLKDVNPGSFDSNPYTLKAAGRYVYFVANDSVSDYELWRTDGTAAGTIRLRDIAAGALAPGPSNLTAAGDVLYFVADDGTTGKELWRTDGTPEGTVMVRDIQPGAAGSDPQWLTAVDGEVWFVADDGLYGRELWRSDGTADGTRLYADVRPGAPSAGIGALTLAGRRLYFRAYDEIAGTELWAVDLETPATVAITDARTTEGNGGTTTLRFTVRRDGDLGGETSVSYTTENLTAASGSDYAAASGTLSFSAGQTTKQIDVVVNGDGDVEQNETLFVVLTSATGAAIARNRATGIIENDDTLSISGSLARTSCFIAEGRLTVRAAAVAAPAGEIRVANNGTTLGSFPLAPSGANGEAAAMVRIQLGQNQNALTFTYVPADGAQPSAMHAQTIVVNDCTGMGTALYVVTPCRLIDTRAPAGAWGGPSLSALGERSVQVTERCGVPASARAIVANVTVVSPAQSGYLRLLPSGVLPRSATSTINFRPAKTRANNAIVTLSSNGAVDVFNASATAVHFIIDVFGYFQ